METTLPEQVLCLTSYVMLVFVEFKENNSHFAVVSEASRGSDASSQGIWRPLHNLPIAYPQCSHTDPAGISLQFLSGVDAWCKMCSEGGLPSEMQDLELAIHHHQSLYEQVTQAYTEVRTKQDTQGFWVWYVWVGDKGTGLYSVNWPGLNTTPGELDVS